MRLIFSEETSVVQTFRTGAGYPAAPADTGEFIFVTGSIITDSLGNLITLNDAHEVVTVTDLSGASLGITL
jgi:hypothetical protein